MANSAEQGIKLGGGHIGHEIGDTLNRELRKINMTPQQVGANITGKNMKADFFSQFVEV